MCYDLLEGSIASSDCSYMCCEMCIERIIDGGGNQREDWSKLSHVSGVSILSEDGTMSMKSAATSRSTRSLVVTPRPDLRVRPYGGSPVGLPTAAPLCPDHSELLNHYCQTCNLSICSTCVIGRHTMGDHDVRTISAMHKEQRKDTKRLLKQMDVDVLELEQSLQELTALKWQIQLALTIQEVNVDKHVENVIAQLQKEAMIVKFIVREKEQLRIQQINKAIARLRDHVEEMTDVRNAAQKTVDNMDRHEYVERHDELVVDIESLLGNDTTGSINRNPIIGMTRCPYDVPFTVDIIANDLIKVQQCHVELVQEFGSHKGPCDIVSTQNGLAVCDRLAKELHLYRQQKNGQYRTLGIHPLSSKNTDKGSYGMAVCEGRYLVTRASHIEMYSQKGKYESLLNLPRTDKTRKGGDVNANAVTMTPDGKTLVIADRDKSTLHTVSPTGKIIKTIPIGIKPHRLAILPHGHVAASDPKTGKVLVIDINSGATIRTFDIPNIKGMQYHRETDCILVARYLEDTNEGMPMAGTGVIEQYCSMSGRLIACLADGLSCPQNITFTHDNMLAVADYRTIKLFSLS